MDKELVKKDISYIGAGFRSISGYIVSALVLNLFYVFALPSLASSEMLGFRQLEIAMNIVAVINVILTFLVLKKLYMIGITFEEISNQF